MKDIVGPADFNLTNCGTINIIKRTSPRGVDQNFSFTSTIGPTTMKVSRAVRENWVRLAATKASASE